MTLHFRDIGHDVNIHDTTYENSQARERTQILMDIANKAMQQAKPVLAATGKEAQFTPGVMARLYPEPMFLLALMPLHSI